MTTRNANVNQPDTKALLDLWRLDIFQNLNCHAVAIVDSFDPDTQLIRASMSYKRTIKGKEVDYPALVDCPAVVLSGGPAHLTFPIEQGDECLIFFSDRDIDNWYSSGNIQPLASNRLHAFTDAIALVGVRSTLRKIAAYDMDHALLTWGETKLGVSSSKVLAKNAAGSLNDRLQDIVSDLSSLVTTLTTLTAAMATATPATVVAAVGVPSATANAQLIALTAQLTAHATALGGLLE